MLGQLHKKNFLPVRLEAVRQEARGKGLSGSKQPHPTRHLAQRQGLFCPALEAGPHLTPTSYLCLRPCLDASK